MIAYFYIVRQLCDIFEFQNAEFITQFPNFMSYCYSYLQLTVKRKFQNPEHLRFYPILW